jgi:HD-like signal output (HDOD) protein/DNA-binding NarL/FixJ family response regulator
MKLSRQRVLVIDDDPAFGAALSRWLVELGTQPTLASSAAEGMKLIEQHEFDLLLLDLNLPDVSGHSIARQLKATRMTLPLIVMSGTDDPDDVVRAFRQNALDFLRKPFRFEDLATALDRTDRRLVDNPGSRPSVSADPVVSPEAPTAKPRPASAPVPERDSGVRPAVTRLLQGLRDGTLTLPAPDTGLTRLTELLSTAQWSTQEVAKLIARDNNFAVGVLRAANSAALSRGVEIRSLAEACTRLGSKTVLAIGLELGVQGRFGPLREPYQTLLANSWKNARATARISSLLAQLLGQRDPGELQLIALFHNIGEQLAIKLIAELDAAGDNRPLEQIAEAIGPLHEPLGAAIAVAWKLPSVVVLFAGHHHRPTREPEPSQDRTIREILLAAWVTSLRIGFTYFPGQEDVNHEEPLKLLGLSDRKIALVTEQAMKWKTDIEASA